MNETMSHYMQGPIRRGPPIRDSAWSVGCACGWKTISRGNKREAKKTWQEHMRSVQRTVSFTAPAGEGHERDSPGQEA